MQTVLCSFLVFRLNILGAIPIDLVPSIEFH